VRDRLEFHVSFIVSRTKGRDGGEDSDVALTLALSRRERECRGILFFLSLKERMKVRASPATDLTER
jgi:hypothetical protein